MINSVVVLCYCVVLFVVLLICLVCLVGGLALCLYDVWLLRF